MWLVCTSRWRVGEGDVPEEEDVPGKPQVLLRIGTRALVATVQLNILQKWIGGRFES